VLNQTAASALTDSAGRPYFLWDCDLTLREFAQRLEHSDPDVRAYFLAKAMRQARPDDVFRFVTWRTLVDCWPRLERYLGQSRPFWAWLLETWERQSRDRADER
jgi:hypothetical protein